MSVSGCHGNTTTKELIQFCNRWLFYYMAVIFSRLPVTGGHFQKNISVVAETPPFSCLSQKHCAGLLWTIGQIWADQIIKNEEKSSTTVTICHGHILLTQNKLFIISVVKNTAATKIITITVFSYLLSKIIEKNHCSHFYGNWRWQFWKRF